MSTIENSRSDEHVSGGRLTDGRLLKTWGAAVTGGWIVSQAVAFAGATSTNSLLGLVTFWLVGSLVPITASFLWMRARSVTGLFPVWTLLGATGLVASFAVVGGAVDVAPVLVLGSLWFAGPAVGFLVTAAYMTDWSRWLYAAAAVVNIAAAVAVATVPAVGAVYFAIAAVIQGFPMLYHGSRLG